MRAQDLARLAALASVWGGSYLFMRYAVPHLGAAFMIELRVAIAGVLMLAYVKATGGTLNFARHWKGYAFVGIAGLALPFMMIAEALKTIDASTASILNALCPFFASIVAAAWIRDPLTPAKLVGIALCLGGTAVLVGWTPRPMTHAELVAAGLSVGAAAVYGFTIVFTKVHLKGASPLGTSVGTLLFAAVAMLPFVTLPANLAAVPPLAWGAIAGLALLSTTLAYLLYYRLIADVGPVKAITVTLLVPIFGMLWGIVFLGEPLTAGRVAGCGIILVGCSLILGLLPLARRSAVPEGKPSADEPVA